MLNVPSDFHGRYLAFLERKGLAAREIGFYLKWLRYYLDFCLKYRFLQEEKSSLSHFLEKLHEKNQTSAQVEQASRAIALYFEVVSIGTAGQKCDNAVALARTNFSNSSPGSVPAKEGQYQKIVMDDRNMGGGPESSPRLPERKEERVSAYLIKEGPISKQKPNFNEECTIPIVLESVPVICVHKRVTGTSWVKEFQCLENEIKVRHYSKKTSGGYTFWLRKFQTFTT